MTFGGLAGLYVDSSIPRELLEQRTLILGAGVAGLSAAYHLRSPYRIFDRSRIVGGAAGSVVINGYTFDQAIHILHTKDAYVASLVKHLLGDNYSSRPRSSWIHSHGTLTRYPYQANMFGLPQEVIRENIEGLLKTKASTSSQANNFREWIVNTFGDGIAKNFLIPFNEKVWAVDLRTMSHDWVSTRVPLPDVEAVLAGATQDNTRQYGENAEFWYPIEGGIGALAQSFAGSISGPVHHGKEITSIDLASRTLTTCDEEQHHFSKIISTIPLPTLMGMISNVPSKLLDLSKQLRSNVVHTVMIGIDRPNISHAHWIYYPEPQFIFQRVSFPMNLSDRVVPPGKSSVIVEISESVERPLMLSTAAMIDQVLSGLRRAGVLRADDRLEVLESATIDPAYVIYDAAHHEVTSKLKAYLASVGIFTCGRFGEWEYFNMDHSILSGKRAAEQADALIGTSAALTIAS